MVPLVASRSPYPSAHRLKPPPDQSGLRKPGDWKVIRFHPPRPQFTRDYVSAPPRGGRRRRAFIRHISAAACVSDLIGSDISAPVMSKISSEANKRQLKEASRGG